MADWPTGQRTDRSGHKEVTLTLRIIIVKIKEKVIIMIIKVIIISVICKKKITYFIYHLSFIKRSPLRWGKGLILSFKRQVIGTGCTAKFMFFSPKNAKLLPSLPLASTELLLLVTEIDRPIEVTVHSGLFQGWAALPQSGEGLQFTWKHNFPLITIPHPELIAFFWRLPLLEL